MMSAYLKKKIMGDSKVLNYIENSETLNKISR